MTQIQTAHGTILGALAGDAAGATLEFLGRKPEQYDVQRAMRMIGRGWWRTAPGQITDDGELAMCLLHQLAGQASFDIERVAKAYLWWYRSRPFDIGNTTSTGLEGGLGQPSGSIAVGMVSASKQQNMGSKANGSLMRIAPLGVWAHRISEEEAVRCARADSSLTHPSDTCQVACALYVIAIRHLMLNPGDGSGAISQAQAWAGQLENADVSGWLDEAVRGEDPGYTPQDGFVRYGFTHGFRHLATGTSYERAIAETLLGGGGSPKMIGPVG